jgi:5-(carboxyamino)imidazole ribonucleotide mutase
MQPAIKMLEQLGIEYAVSIMSAHRSPGKVKEFASSARRNGFEVIIAGAGGAAHLPGVVASWTSLPVIGVPLATSELKGIDALYSIVQMPSGVPVGSVGIGGAKNAALLAARILSIKYSAVAEAYAKYQKELEAS